MNDRTKNIQKISGASAPHPVTPGSTRIKEAAEALFEKAEAAGVRIGADQTSAFSEAIRRTLAEKRALNKEGKVLERFWLLRAAQETVDESAGSSATPVELLTIREGIEAAAKSKDEGEKLIGKGLLENFDEFSNKLSPEFARAGVLFRRADRAALFEQAHEAAIDRANGARSGPDFDQALIAEYRGLRIGIESGELEGFIPAEIEAIRRVMHPTPIFDIICDIISPKQEPEWDPANLIGGQQDRQ